MSASFSERLAARRAHASAAAAHLAAVDAMTEAGVTQADRVAPDEIDRSITAAHIAAARAHEAAAQAAILVQFGADAALSASASHAALAASRAADPELDQVSGGYLADGTSLVVLSPSERVAPHTQAAVEHESIAGCVMKGSG